MFEVIHYSNHGTAIVKFGKTRYGKPLAWVFEARKDTAFLGSPRYF